MATEQLGLQANVVWYGKQKSPSFQNRRNLNIPGEFRRDVKPYALFGLNANYRLNKNLRFVVGVNNVFDKQLFRAGSSEYAGANTYNEAGRSYFASATVSF